MFELNMSRTLHEGAETVIASVDAGRPGGRVTEGEAPTGVTGVPGVAELLGDTREWLSGLTDVDGLTRAECLQVITVAEEIKSAVSAVQARATVHFVEQVERDASAARAREEITRGEARRRSSSARSEVALARRCSPVQADRHVATARAWCSVLPETMSALTAGRVCESRAGVVAQETTCLSPPDRREVDRRLAVDLTRLGDRALRGAAHRACTGIDPASVVRRNEKAVASRRVSTRPAPDGMAWLSVLGPLTDVVGAHASLTAAEAARFVATGDPQVDAERAADERSRGAWMADTALERLSGRDEGQAQPVEVGLVMSDTTLLPTPDDPGDGATGHPTTGHDEPDDDGAVEVPGWGALPPHIAREHLTRLLDQLESAGSEEERRSGIWLRRLFTSPDGRNLVAMGSRQRFHSGALRALITLRDATCRVPWCDAPTRQVDHARPAVDGGRTSATNGWGLCVRHNLDKETPGWRAAVTATGLDPGNRPHQVRLTTLHGQDHRCPAPPLLGVGRDIRRPREPGPPTLTRSRFEVHLDGLHAA